MWDDGTLHWGSSDGDKISGDRGKSEGFGDRLDMVSGGRDLVSRITLMFLISHNWIMMMSIIRQYIGR